MHSDAQLMDVGIFNQEYSDDVKSNHGELSTNDVVQASMSHTTSRREPQVYFSLNHGSTQSMPWHTFPLPGIS
jgi:hypothetical protein